MSEPAAYSIDRAGWPPGPWDTEPDRLEWRHRGLPCLIVRNGMGALCGYVGVAPAHLWHGESANDINASAHGGITYAAACSGHICHVPQSCEPDNVWWVGFDCAHAWDITPSLASRLAFAESTYRTIDYVRAEVEQHADQALSASALR